VSTVESITNRPGKTAAAIDSSKLLPVALRDDFPILQQTVHGDRPLVFLDNAASTQRPRQVIEVLRRVYERDYANVHRGIHTLSERATEQYEEAREKARAFIGARHFREIIFTSGTTAGINLVARSWGDENVKVGDEILVTTMEHHSNLVPWQQLAERTGAVIRHVPITDDGLLVLDALDSLLTDRTRIVAVASVSSPVDVLAKGAVEAVDDIKVHPSELEGRKGSKAQDPEEGQAPNNGHTMKGNPVHLGCIPSVRKEVNFVASTYQFRHQDLEGAFRSSSNLIALPDQGDPHPWELLLSSFFQIKKRNRILIGL